MMLLFFSQVRVGPVNRGAAEEEETTEWLAPVRPMRNVRPMRYHVSMTSVAMVDILVSYGNVVTVYTGSQFDACGIRKCRQRTSR